MICGKALTGNVWPLNHSVCDNTRSLKMKAIWLPIYCIIRYFRHSVSGIPKIAQLTKCSLNTAHWKAQGTRFRYNKSYQKGSATSDNCVVYDYYEIAIIINLLYIFYNAPVPYATMQHFVTEMYTRAHISVTKCCIVGYLCNELWDLWDVSVVTT